MSLTKFSISSSRNIILAAFVTILVTSCGFTPLYAKKGGKTHSCTNFTVSEIKGFDISGQKLQYRLQDSLNQVCIKEQNNYRITMDLRKSKEAIAIQRDRVITRYNLNISGTYKVYKVGEEKPITTGTSNMVGGYDTVISDYGVYALEQDTEEKLLEEMANDITLRVSSVLLRKD